MRKYRVDEPTDEEALSYVLDERKIPALLIRREQMPDEFTSRELGLLRRLAHRANPASGKDALRVDEALRGVLHSCRAPKHVREFLKGECRRQTQVREARELRVRRAMPSMREEVGQSLTARLRQDWPFRRGNSSWVETSNFIELFIDPKVRDVVYKMDDKIVWHPKHAWKAKSYYWYFTIAPAYRDMRVEGGRLVFRSKKTGEEVIFVQSRGMDLRRLR